MPSAASSGKGGGVALTELNGEASMLSTSLRHRPGTEPHPRASDGVHSGTNNDAKTGERSAGEETTSSTTGRQPLGPERTVWKTLCPSIQPNCPRSQPRKPRRWRRNLPRQENESHSLKEYFSVIKTSSSLRKPPPKQELIAEIKKEEGCAVEEGSDDDVVLVENLSNADKRGGAQGSTAAARLGEEEELAITGTSGPIWNVDFPHLRHDCGIHDFEKKPCNGNKKACDKCICFICDDFVSKCSQWDWGKGPHCHAHRTDHYIRRRDKTKEHLREKVEAHRHKEHGDGTAGKGGADA